MDTNSYFALLIVIALFTMGLVGSNAACATEQLPPRGPALQRPSICVPVTPAAPTIDGNLSDPAWAHAVAIRPFTLSYPARFAPFHAQAGLMYDA